MRNFALLTLAAWVLALGSAQARVVSSSIEAGEFENPTTDALLIHPSHAAMFDVRASPDAPVDVSWRVHCRSKAQNRVAKHRITTEKLPIRIRMPIIVPKPGYCNLSGEANYKSSDQNGRIAIFIRY